MYPHCCHLYLLFQFITFHSIFRERVINSSRGWLEEMSVQGLQPGTSYRVRVVAQAEAGAGATSEVSTLLLFVCFSIIIFLSL